MAINKGAFKSKIIDISFTNTNQAVQYKSKCWSWLWGWCWLQYAVQALFVSLFFLAELSIVCIFFYGKFPSNSSAITQINHFAYFSMKMIKSMSESQTSIKPQVVYIRSTNLLVVPAAYYTTNTSFRLKIWRPLYEINTSTEEILQLVFD